MLTEASSPVQSHATSAQLLDELPTPVMAVDRDFRVLYLNRAGERVLGLEPGGAEGRRCYDLFRTAHCRTESCRVARAMSRGGVHTGDTVARPGSAELPIRYTGAPLYDETGQLVGGLEYVVDISGEKQIAAAVRELSGEITAGHLARRATPDGFEGSYRELLESVNEVVDAFEAPIRELLGVLAVLAEGDLRERVRGSYEGDYAALKQAANRLGESFQNTLSQIQSSSASLASASQELSAASGQLASNAEQSSARATQVAAANEEVTQGVQTVSSASEEMAVSIQEIAKNADSATEVARRAVDAARDASQRMDELDRSSTEIGQVIKLITSVAQQTNLLALNATIEAARAGEAGKGFAVVAGEVKELAKQTADATEEIRSKIEAIQTTTGSAIGSIGEIAEVIARIDEIQQTIAAAVEQQSASTSEISRSVTEAARGGVDIGSAMGEMSAAAGETSEAAGRTLEQAQGLSSLAKELDGLAGAFKIS